MLNTPILLITFNRPDHTRRVLEAILTANPKDLYVFQDGAREGNEADVVKCQQVRDVINELVTTHQTPDTTHQTPITLHTNYSSINLGCGPGPVAAISWFFEHAEYGIILEDDIYPHPLFFSYMNDLLARYKDDYRVGMVCGHNLQRAYYGKASYHFTNAMAGTLGWGTWRRVWKDFQWDIPFDAIELDNALTQYYHTPKVLRNRIVKAYSKWLGGTRHDSWDYQWDYYLTLHGYLNARANACLTSHEGNDGNGTHTYDNPNYLMEVNESLFLSLKHPRCISVNPIIKLNTIYKALRAIIGNICKKQ